MLIGIRRPLSTEPAQRLIAQLLDTQNLFFQALRD
jgi:hypothetical protein